MDRQFIVGLLRVGEPAPPSDPAGALAALRFHGLEGLAVARDRELGGHLLGEELRAELEPVYRAQGLLTTLTVEAAERAHATLSRAGIESLVFKGAALVRDGTYRDPGSRAMDDADMLVRPKAAPAAVEALLSDGFVPVTGWGRDRMAWADAVALHDVEAPAGSTVAVDLHWRTGYDQLRFGHDRESVLWAGAEPTSGWVAPEVHLVVVAEHLLKHLRYKVHLAAFGDLARMAGRVRSWETVARHVRRSRLERGIRGLLRALRRDLGTPVPSGAGPAGRGRVPAILAPSRLVGCVRTAEGRVAGVVQRWRHLSAPGAILGEAADAAFPPASWMRGRYGDSGPRVWLRYMADLALWSVVRGRSPASPNQELFSPTARE